MTAVTGPVAALEDVAAVSLLHDGDDRELLAVASDRFLSGPELRAVVAAAGVHPPDRVVVVPARSAGALNHVDAILADPAAAVYDFRPPRDDLERSLCAIWQETLEVDAVGVEDDLLDLGGDSITVMEIALRVQQHTGVELDLADVFEAGTVRALATRVADLRGPGAPGADRPDPT
ncbi:phosphopantetheine-binding protein [Cellulomonas sp. S1-8]|uniref:phosphopantetheine-binding protein n=1 Tax=Cellulomonas sp. S1-8 TaxID=2904790 RepID=UPI002244F4C0|nr:phosphopantetheine-binding protein [Cellulomonas sp. S1-8]UZN03402.1 phosphopantetheine-binding protein [Cellulomonas sp. S1-8]